jgi:hypothetical protein
MFLDAITDEHLAEADGSFYELFLPRIADAILGSNPFEKSTVEGKVVGTKKILARSVAFGADVNAWLPDYLTCARDGCSSLQAWDLGEAILAIDCLICLHRANGGSPFHEEIDRFLVAALQYLNWTISMVNDSAMKWELRILTYIVASRGFQAPCWI